MDQLSSYLQWTELMTSVWYLRKGQRVLCCGLNSKTGRWHLWSLILGCLWRDSHGWLNAWVCLITDNSAESLQSNRPSVLLLKTICVWVLFHLEPPEELHCSLTKTLQVMHTAYEFINYWNFKEKCGRGNVTLIGSSIDVRTRCNCVTCDLANKNH